MKLLIVEDNEAMRRLLRSLVQDLAEAVYECGDGADAFSAYAVCHPDWVLMDIKLPKTDGITATSQITTAWPEAKVMIVTEYDDAKLREAARQAGAQEYVLKENLMEVRRVLLG